MLLIWNQDLEPTAQTFQKPWTFIQSPAANGFLVLQVQNHATVPLEGGVISSAVQNFRSQRLEKTEPVMDFREWVQLMWAKQCHLHHPSVITVFWGGMVTIPRKMGGLWHDFTHQKFHYIDGCSHYFPFYSHGKTPWVFLCISHWFAHRFVRFSVLYRPRDWSMEALCEARKEGMLFCDKLRRAIGGGWLVPWYNWIHPRKKQRTPVLKHNHIYGHKTLYLGFVRKYGKSKSTGESSFSLY